MKITIFILLLLSPLLAHTQTKQELSADPLRRIGILDQVRAFTINDVFSYYGNSGVADYNHFTGNSGWEYPKGTDLPPLVRSKLYIGDRAEGGQNEGQEVFCGTGRFEASRS